MVDREKLSYLIAQVQDCGCDVTDVVEMIYVENDVLVDHLIANGVTIQRWIPVTELPMDKSGHYLTCDHKGNMHVMFHHKCYDDPFGIDENHHAYFPVLWFMPLPEAPKGE